MKKMKVVMVEYIAEGGGWEWYAVVRNTTPRKAIVEYLKDMGLNTRQKIEYTPNGADHEMQAIEDDVRAYWIEI